MRFVYANGQLAPLRGVGTHSTMSPPGSAVDIDTWGEELATQQEQLERVSSPGEISQEERNSSLSIF